VHSAAVLAEDGFGHEAGMIAVSAGDLLDGDLVGHHRVRHGEGILVPKVDLMLRGSDLVVAVLHIDAHGVQGENGVPPQVGSVVCRGQVEISAVIQDIGVVLSLEVEELQLRAYQEAIAVIFDSAEVPFEHISGVALIRGAIGVLDVTEHPGHGVLLLPPGDELEGGWIGLGNHIRLVDSGEALYG